jgi:hypothetical protein
MLLGLLKSNGIEVRNPKRPRSVAPGWYGYRVVVEGNEVDIVVDSNPIGYKILVAHNNIIGESRRFSMKDCADVLGSITNKKMLTHTVIKIRFGKVDGRKLYSA